MKETILTEAQATEIANLLKSILFELTTMPPIPGCSSDGYFPIVTAAQAAKSALNILTGKQP